MRKTKYGENKRKRETFVEIFVRDNVKLRTVAPDVIKMLLVRNKVWLCIKK